MERKCRVCKTIIVVRGNDISVKAGTIPMCDECIKFIQSIPEKVSKDGNST